MVVKASVTPGVIATLLKEKRRLKRAQKGMAPKSYEMVESKKSLRNTSMMEYPEQPQFKSSFQKKA